MNEREQSQVRAETAAGIKNVIQGLDGAGWADACLKNPHITLPPGAGYIMVRHFQQVIIDAAERMAQITGFLDGDTTSRTGTGIRPADRTTDQ